MHKIVSLDPGGTTGYALAVFENPKLLYIAYDQAKMNELELYDFLFAVNPDALICEDFEYRGGLKTKVDLTPVRMIGVVNLYCIPHIYVEGKPRLFMQSPSTGKAFYDDAKIEKLGLHRPRRHGKDALRHLLQWFIFGAGAKLWMNHTKEPELKLVEEGWLRDGYFS